MFNLRRDYVTKVNCIMYGIYSAGGDEVLMGMPEKLPRLQFSQEILIRATF